jgi:arylsulfatase A-like enzyme/cytochrome c-type biogenesis protein CcmH/NrfG
LCLLLLAASAFAQKPAASAPKKPQLPNVVLITIDTLRADHLGSYGYRGARTPNLDALAAAGVRFQSAYTPVPITLPAHAALLTGTYPTKNGMHDFSANKLGAGEVSLATVLRGAGYRTGAVVGSAVLDSRFGMNQGFDFYYDHFDFNRLLETNLDAMERPGNEVMDQALAWLGKNGAHRFFLWVHLYDPHYPYRPPAPYGEQFKANPYDGEIAFADVQVGRLVKSLQSKGLYGNTLVVVAGDHGEGLGEHDEKTHGFFIYNSTLHVPLIVKLPARGGVKPRVVADDVSLVDVMPTVLELLALDAPAGVQGKSRVALLQGKAPEEPSELYSETFLPRLHFNWSELRGLQAGGYHFIDAPKPELYDLKNDPRELNNLFAAKKAVSEELRGKLTATIRRNTPERETAEKTGLDPALAERLKSLGYAAFSGGSAPAAAGAKLPDPKDRIAVYERISEAIEDSQQGRFAASAEKLRATLATESDSVPVHYLLGIDYFRLKDFPAAVRQFRRVLELSPDYALALFYLGLSYAYAGETDQAITALQRTLALDATNFSAAFNLGVAYMQKQQSAEAMAAFQRSVEINPDYAQGHRALGEMLLYQGRVDEALAALRKAAALAPEQAAVHASLAKALAAKGLHQEAQAEMEKARALGAPR